MIFGFNFLLILSFQTLQEVQAENFSLRNQLKKLKLELSVRDTTEEGKKPRKVSRGSADLPSNIVQFDGDISKYGRKYSLMICPWIDTNVFQNLSGRPDIDPLSEDRFSDNVTMLAGTVAELYDFIPANLHNIMENHSHFMTIASVLLLISF